jgi:hypothetical protein
MASLMAEAKKMIARRTMIPSALSPTRSFLVTVAPYVAVHWCIRESAKPLAFASSALYLHRWNAGSSHLPISGAISPRRRGPVTPRSAYAPIFISQIGCCLT